MAKLKLVPNPEFSAAVDIPIHGGGSVPVKFTFVHRPKPAIKDWIEATKEKADPDIVLDMLVAWELDDELNRENVELLLDNYAGAGAALFEAYLRELSQARAKN